MVRTVFQRLILLSVVVCAGVALGQTQRIGNEFRVNTYTTAYQDSPQVARNGVGAFVVVWESAPFSNGVAQDGSGTGIFGQRFDLNGVKQGGEFQVNTYTSGPQSYPYVSVDNSGNFVVVWQSLIQDGSLMGGYGQRFNSAGTKVGGEFRLNTYTTNDQTSPVVDYDGSGNFVAVWESYAQVGSYVGIFGQRYTSAGALSGTEFRANTYTRDDQGYPQVSKDGAGNFVVVWHSYSQDGSAYGIWGQRYTSAGAQTGQDFQINTYTSHSQQFPTVSRNAAGAFVVAWESYAQDGSDYGIYAQRYQSNGNKSGAEFRVNTYTTAQQRDAQVAMDGAGNFVVVWKSSPGFAGTGQDGSASGIFGQRYNANGTTHGVEFRVNTYTTGNQIEPSVSMDTAGNFVVVWTSIGQDQSATGVFGQKFSAADCPAMGNSGPVANQSSCMGATAFFTVTPTGLGPFTYQWQKGNVDLVDGPFIVGSKSATLKVKNVHAIDAGSYRCIIKDYCLPAASLTSAFGNLTVTGGQASGVVTGLKLQKLNNGANLKLTWNNTTNSTDYVVFEDTAPNGAFTTQIGTVASGLTGITVAMPSSNRYYLVAGRNATCGVGPQD
jgi:hypothetical protein